MGDIAVVVGVNASAGLGAAVARRFAREGVHVVLAGRTPERLAQVCLLLCVCVDTPLPPPICACALVYALQSSQVPSIITFYV